VSVFVTRYLWIAWDPVTVFAVVCFVVMWSSVLASVYAAEHNRRAHGIEWSAWVYGSLSLAFYISGLDAWVWL